MGPLSTPIQSCLRHNYTVFAKEVLVFFLPLVPVNDTGFETSAESLENFLLF